MLRLTTFQRVKSRIPKDATGADFSWGYKDGEEHGDMTYLDTAIIYSGIDNSGKSFRGEFRLPFPAIFGDRRAERAVKKLKEYFSCAPR